MTLCPEELSQVPDCAHQVLCGVKACSLLVPPAAAIVSCCMQVQTCFDNCECAAAFCMIDNRTLHIQTTGRCNKVSHSCTEFSRLCLREENVMAILLMLQPQMKPASVLLSSICLLPAAFR